jgi:hypothetical protein
MSGSSTALWIICVVGTLAIVAAVLIPRLASRRPHHANPQRGQLRGVVQGGQHVGGGRSVAPTRDAPVPEGGGDPPETEEQKAAYGHRPPVEGRGNPLDIE